MLYWRLCWSLDWWIGGGHSFSVAIHPCGQHSNISSCFVTVFFFVLYVHCLLFPLFCSLSAVFWLACASLCFPSFICFALYVLHFMFCSLCFVLCSAVSRMSAEKFQMREELVSAIVKPPLPRGLSGGGTSATGTN